MSEQTQEERERRRKINSMSNAEMMEVLNHLIELFELPPCLMSLEITWRAGEALTVSCKSFPASRENQEGEWM